MVVGPILLTGATGQVGGELLRMLAPFGEVLAPGRNEMDLADLDSVRGFIRSARPRWIVNPAAYTAVDRAEAEPELADAINHHAVAVMGEEARALGAAVLHFSTDYVFSGTGTIPYREDDATGPQSVYGVSKLAGEKALATSGAAHLILRTSWVYGATGKNFLLTILKLARERETLRIVADQRGAPTWSGDLARLTAAILAQCETRSKDRPLTEAVSPVNGVYHATGGGETTWHGFAAEAVRLMLEQEPGTRFADLVPIATTQFPTPARRPLNSRLANEKLASTFGWRMPEWRQSLAAVLEGYAPRVDGAGNRGFISDTTAKAT